MGYLQGTIVHNHTTGTTCETVVVIDDNPSNYNSIPVGNSLQQGLLGVLDSASRNNLTRFTSVATENNTWHYIHECPYG